MCGLVTLIKLCKD